MVGAGLALAAGVIHRVPVVVADGVVVHVEDAGAGHVRHPHATLVQTRREEERAEHPVPGLESANRLEDGLPDRDPDQIQTRPLAGARPGAVDLLEPPLAQLSRGVLRHVAVLESRRLELGVVLQRLHQPGQAVRIAEAVGLGEEEPGGASAGRGDIPQPDAGRAGIAHEDIVGGEQPLDPALLRGIGCRRGDDDLESLAPQRLAVRPRAEVICHLSARVHERHEHADSGCVLASRRTRRLHSHFHGARNLARSLGRLDAGERHPHVSEEARTGFRRRR